MFFLDFVKALNEAKASGLRLSFNIFRNPRFGRLQKQTVYCKALDYGFRDMRNFFFLEKRLGIVSPPHFLYYFSRKMFLMLCYIN